MCSYQCRPIKSILIEQPGNQEVHLTFDVQDIYRKQKSFDSGQPALTAQADMCRYSFAVSRNRLFTEHGEFDLLYSACGRYGGLE